MATGKLRHIPVTVPNLEEAARCYGRTLEMKRIIDQPPVMIMFSDGVMSLAIAAAAWYCYNRILSAQQTLQMNCG